MTITYAIIFITAAVSITAFNNPAIRQNLVFSPWLIRERKEYFRFITSGFLHADWQHLIFNMLTLFFFGRNVEARFHEFPNANLKFLFLYLGGMVCASMYSYFKHKENPYYSALGASGAVSAILFAEVLFDPWGWILVKFIIPVPAFLFAIFYVWYSARMSRQGNDNIGHDAHLYGAIFGIIATIVMNPPILLRFLEKITQPNFPFF